MLILFDSDSPCYAQALSVQKDGGLIQGAEKIMCRQLDEFFERCVLDIEEHFKTPVDYKLFLTGKGNFRETEFPSYKANRKGAERPILLPEARQYLQEEYNAVVVDGMEADDAVCIEQALALQDERNTIIAHLDKDIDQQAGWHYRWAFRGKPSIFYRITEEQGLQHLYQQALVGDQVDCIMYYFNEDSQTWRKEYGCGKVKARKLLKDCETEKDLYRICLEQYKEWGRTERDLQDNLHQLYMIRKLNPRTGEAVRWKKPKI